MLSIILIVILHAWIDSIQIKQGIRIFHGFETFAYFCACSPYILFYPWWQVLLISITTRMAFFDIALNLFRGLPWTYNGAGKSVIDRFENKLKLNPVVLRIVGIVIFLISLFI